MKILIVLSLTAALLVSDAPILSKNGLKKLNQTLAALYPGQKIQLKKLDLTVESITDTDILNADGKWFAVKLNGSNLGWLMAEKIWGRYHEFEYAMIVDTNRKIIEVSVLNYPDTHGQAVTNRNWLSGFTGITPDHPPVYSQDIDAMSGATISGTNLTESVAKSLAMLQKLHDQNLLK
jgi:Na+-translocating ferredoxin:NAD+ oxidoreductase RnfG subunit